MILSELHVHNLRNLQPLRVNLHPHINFVTGLNGSGKTSFLEAIYLLGNGHSFRAREISSLVTYQQSALSVFTKTADEQTVSISKSLSAATGVKINGTPCFASSQLAYLLPTQIFYQDIFQIIDSGPSVRRSVLDWGLFHVEHTYHSLWKNYRRALKQRNSLLKQQASAQQFAPWDKLLSDLANELDESRAHYVLKLNERFKIILHAFSDLSCQLNYYKGWDRKQEGIPLGSVLEATLAADRQRQFTHYGPHHADIMITIDEHKARFHLSRGQQKMVLFALKLAQAELLSRHCIHLIDDINAELDPTHLSRLIEYIKTNDSQFIITSNTSGWFTDFFHEHHYELISLDKGQRA